MISRIINALKERLDYKLRHAICDNVASWARDRGIKVTHLHDPIPHRQFPSEVYQMPPNDDFLLTYQDLEKPQELVVFANTKVRGRTGIVYLPDGKVCLQGHWWPFIFALNDDHTVLRRRYTKAFQSGDIYSLLCTWGQHYYHWLHDVLPRLYTTLPHLPNKVRFLVNRKITPLQIESLAAFGISTTQLVYQDDGSDTIAERLWFSTPLGNTFFSSIPVMNEVRRTLSRRLSPHPRRPSRMVFISRQGAEKRRITNEADFRLQLESRGFEFIQAEAMEFKAQVELFSETKVLLGSHGAGLANMLFMPRGGDIIEIFEPQTVYVHYWAMAQDCDHRYHPIFGETVNNGKEQPNIRVDLLALLALVDSVLTASTSR